VPHLAQINLAQLQAPLDSPQLADFVNNLDRINALAESSPGFVWRLIGEGNNATDLRPFPNPDVIVNISVWESVETFGEFVYKSEHTKIVRRRREWFDKMDTPPVGLWHVPVGHVPTLGEARVRIDHLTRYGPSACCFGFRDKPPVLTIERADLSADIVRALIGELNVDIAARYPDDTDNYFTLTEDDVRPESGGFFVAYLDGVPAGCGACRTLDGGSVELKRMYSRPTARGNGIGAALVSHLCGVARDLGRTRVVLETGPEQPEAIHVYKKAGFTPIPLFGQYIESNTSICFEMSLG
jgi:GNAT superfamily N-acetyltransferase/heme-degrading monooxygenase HmoA